MLRWRLILGVLLVGLLATLFRLDLQAARAGLLLVPLAILLCLLATQEMLRIFRASGMAPLAGTAYAGTLLAPIAASAPIAWLEYPPDCPVGRLGWLAVGLAAGLLTVVVGEMARYCKLELPPPPGRTTSSLSAAALCVLYVGGLLGFLIQLRLLPVAGDVSRGGLLAMLSMIVVVKATDIGAYTVGRIWGQHKLAPVLSPGKTWEGVGGGLIFGMISALIVLGPLADTMGLGSGRERILWVTCVLIYAMLVSVAGILGDLAESLLKRDANMKDSSTWLPGFGGVLDLLDSLLVAAPIAYFCWVSGLLGY